MRTVIIAVAVLALAGCMRQTPTISQPGAPAAPQSNPSDFPLYQPSTIVSVAPFDQSEMAAALNKTRSAGQATIVPYRGNEVLATTPATLAKLEEWLRGVKAAPPAGSKATSATLGGSKTDISTLDEWGADTAAFEYGDGHREVAVIVMDPKTVRAKIGPALDIIDKYQALPGILRSGIDNESKKQFGFSVSQMLDRSGPVGLFIGAVRDLSDSHERAIILVDASKE